MKVNDEKLLEKLKQKTRIEKPHLRAVFLVLREAIEEVVAEDGYLRINDFGTFRKRKKKAGSMYCRLVDKVVQYPEKETIRFRWEKSKKYKANKAELY